MPHDDPALDQTVRDRDTPDAFKDSISTALTDLIHSVGVNGRLPTERDMALQLGVSRNALRDRLQLVEALGVVRRRQGAGTFVEPMNTDGLIFALNLMISSAHIRLDQLHTVRVALERQAAMSAAEHVTDQIVDRLRAAVMAMRQAEPGDALTDADFHFHHELFRCTDNPALTFFADALHSALYRALQQGSAQWARRELSQNLLVTLHVDIVDAIEAGDPAAAGKAIDDHFIVANRLTWGADEPPAR